MSQVLVYYPHQEKDQALQFVISLVYSGLTVVHKALGFLTGRCIQNCAYAWHLHPIKKKIFLAYL